MIHDSVFAIQRDLLMTKALILRSSNFCFYGKNPITLLLKWNLFSSSFTRCFSPVYKMILWIFLSALSLILIKIKRFLHIYTHQIYLGAVQSPVDGPVAFCWPDHCALLRVLVADYSNLPGFSSLVPPWLASRHAGAFALRSLSLRWAGSRTAVWDFLPRF